MRPCTTRSACALAVLLAAPLFRAAADSGHGGLGIDEVRLPGLAIGKTYSTWHLAQAPVVVRNASDDTVQVRVGFTVPARHELRGKAEPLPDRQWVEVESELLVVAPGGTAQTDVLLSVPYDPELAGHTYQVDLWSRSVARDGSLGAVQRHRLLFRVEMDYRDDTEIDFARRSARPKPLL